jgi:hypothetical protein
MLGKALRTLGNMLKTHMELDGNILRTKKFQKYPTDHHPPPKEKRLGSWGACYLTSLAAKKFYVCLCSFTSFGLG